MLIAPVFGLLASLDWFPGDRWYTWALLGGIFLMVILGTWAGAVASGKGRSAQWWFIIGFFIPVLGLVAAYLVRPAARGGSGGSSNPKG